MPEIPEHLLRRSAEAKAKALGVPVEQVLAEMRGEATPEAAEPVLETPSPVAETPAEPAASTPEVESEEEPEAASEEATAPEAPAAAEPAAAEPVLETEAEVTELPAASPEPAPAAEVETPPPPAAAVGAERVATAVAPRPVAQPEAVPEGVRTQRLLTVVKARAIQQVKPTPSDKVNTWPHLMIAEFTALMVMTAFLVILSVILQAPILELANFNATPNPSKAPWYFLGLQELLSYYDPQIAGVMIPTITGLIGFMAVPYVDRNPSTKPSDRKFAILLFTIFLAGSATLTVLGTLFRGPGFNFTYPWADGIWFDDLKDWVEFE
ncbi:MAG: hypothetical protein OEM97_02685 [Acidimicrobiia bacterium]|nr:hypothetical protein [Acidimicrobiia bacterium]